MDLLIDDVLSSQRGDMCSPGPVLDHAEVPVQKRLVFFLCHGPLTYLRKNFLGFMIHLQF